MNEDDILYTVDTDMQGFDFDSEGANDTAQNYGNNESEPDSNKITFVSFFELMTSEHKKPEYVVEGLVLSGLALFGGIPKSGKTVLSYLLAYCVATGRPFLGMNTKKGRVLYCDGETTEGRSFERIQNMGLDVSQDIGLDFCYEELPPIGEGFEDFISKYLEDNPDTKMIVIDTLAKIMPQKDNTSINIYKNESKYMGTLRRFATDRGIAIVLVHHLSKKETGGNAGLGFYGSNAMIGCVDTFFTITRASQMDEKVHFEAKGNAIEPKSMDLIFKDMRWSIDDGTYETKEDYMNDPLIAGLKNYLEMNNNVWQGKMSELKSGIEECGYDIKDSAQKMQSSLINKYRKNLEADGIIISHIGASAGCNKYKIEKKDQTEIY